MLMLFWVLSGMIALLRFKTKFKRHIGVGDEKYLAVHAIVSASESVQRLYIFY
jgi:hypothetical protein